MRRKKYIISAQVDCEGSEYVIHYLGDNIKAIKDRLQFVKDKYIDTYFISNGLDEADISIRFYGKPIEELEHGDVYTIVMTDDNCCWITVDVTCLEQYHFKSNGYETTYHDLFRGKY